ncbi:hypothetical protein NC652_000649 [Populus alba x Populus x berolinensis]|nr:hypothetical protein NC652_000649 [Populus alba x Populus x berolinensis]
MSICLENEPSLSVYKEKRSVSWSQTPCLVLATAGQSRDQKADCVVNHNQGKVSFGAKSLTIRACNDVVIDLAAFEFRAKLGDDD